MGVLLVATYQKFRKGIESFKVNVYQHFETFIKHRLKKKPSH